MSRTRRGSLPWMSLVGVARTIMAAAIGVRLVGVNALVAATTSLHTKSGSTSNTPTNCLDTRFIRSLLLSANEGESYPRQTDPANR